MFYHMLKVKNHLLLCPLSLCMCVNMLLLYHFFIFIGINLSLPCRPPIYCVKMMHCHVVILQTVINGSCCCQWPYVHLGVRCLLLLSLCSYPLDIHVVLN
jgi:hypothetical protein